jgi:hypothetical protein
MASRRRSASQRAITRGKIKKLQRAGLVSARIDADKPPSKLLKAKFYKYRSILSGKSAAVKVSSAAKARELRGKIGYGGEGRAVIVPREKGERFKVGKNDTITSTRKAYGATIEKKILGDKFAPPRAGEKLYYTIPKRRRGTASIKRTTFSSFDEMLYYLEKYEINFDDVEDYIEVERFKEGSRRERQERGEYLKARRRLQKKRAKSKSKKRKGSSRRKR